MAATTTQTIHLMDCPACGKSIELHATYDVHRDEGIGIRATAKVITATLKNNPDTTVSESPCAECERLRAVVHTQGVAIDGYLVEVERLREGLPIVRTVGDLTARHVGRRVRLDEHYDAKLETIFAHDGGEVSLNFTHPEGFAFGCSRPLDTPCEVQS